MNKIFWKVSGVGNYDLVLLHGWGSNSSIWNSLIKKLCMNFRIHSIDLPGYGHNKDHEFFSLEEISNLIALNAPDEAIWLGWSLGGVIAMEVATKNKKSMKALITVSSSPFFCQDKDWPGMDPVFLLDFAAQLKRNFLRTINRFFHLQTMKTKYFHKNIVQQLKNSFFSFPLPNLTVLLKGLSILRTSDFRNILPKIWMPFLHLYGGIDILIPSKVSMLVNTLCPKSKYFIFLRAAHVPFLSHTNEFCKVIQKFIQNI